jgi:hypothetical protein
MTDSTVSTVSTVRETDMTDSTVRETDMTDSAVGGRYAEYPEYPEYPVDSFSGRISVSPQHKIFFCPEVFSKKILLVSKRERLPSWRGCRQGTISPSAPSGDDKPVSTVRGR